MGLSCGNPVATASLQPGEVVVDLGCGGGLDVLLAARQVGPTGKAIGIDMTADMLERARAGAEKVGAENVEFHLAQIDALPLPENSVDCIISNCVINLVPDKEKAFREMFRVLRPGGRLSISDIALRQPLPTEVQENIAAYVGCIAGAILIEDYRRRLETAGFQAVVISDTNADLNAYAKAGLTGSGCCTANDTDSLAQGSARACCGTGEVRTEQLTTLMLVARPEPSALSETARTCEELRQLGICNQQLIVNGVFAEHDSEDPVARALARRGQQSLGCLPEALRCLNRATVPLAGTTLLGVEALRSLGSQSGFTMHQRELDRPNSTFPEVLGSLIDDLAAPGRGVILTMGKGGVGKTTVAAAVAVALAQRGFDVHLSTTDPADHLAHVLASDSLSTLSVGRIDPALETANYSTEVMDTAGANLDAHGKALLAEDLRSPCTEEIAVFRAFARTVATGADRFVVLDTAPTGHTILLLDAALA